MFNIKISMAAVLFCSSAYAAEEADLGSVSITATKTAQSTLESPASVEIVTAKKIEEKSVQRADEAIKDVAGVYLRADADHTPNSWSNSVTLRGVPMYYRTAVLVDDVVMNNAFSAGVNWSNIPVEDIERVEVVKGPFSSLYGGNAMSGVINVITKEPTKREVVIKTGYGSDNYKNFIASYRDKITDKLGININFGKKTSDGYINDLVVKTPTTGTGGTVVSGARQSTDSTGKTVYIVGDKGTKGWWEDDVGIKLHYSFNNDNKISAGFSHHKHATKYDHLNTYLSDGAGNPVISGSVQLDATSKATLAEKDFLFGPTGEETDRYTFSYESKIFDDVKVKLNTHYTDYGYWYISQSTGAVSSGGAGTYTDIPNTTRFGSLQLSFPLGNINYIVMGIDLNHNELAKKVNVLPNWTDDSTRTTLNSESNGKNTTKALFIQDTIDITDNLVAYIGGRYDSWVTSGSYIDYTKSTSTNYEERRDSHFSPKASLVYMPDAHTTLRTSAGQAFRAPSLSDLYSSFYSGSKLYSSSPDLKPETLTSWEIGFEHIFDTKTHFKTTYYENYLKDLMYTTDISATLNEKRNAGKAEIKGIELEVQQEVTDGLNAFANFTYNHTEITENINKPEIVGKRMTYVPMRQFNVGMSGEQGGWSGSLIGCYVDDITTKDDNSDIYKSTYGGYESYFTVDAKIGYQIQKWINASIAVNNIFDKEFYQSSLTPGRTVYGELTFKF
ncbi:MAG: TonB-dependent receptor [Sulfuricurvum sp.]|uniref:TonB-dependent receptor n=1 Tax=Sulfuricurvum sp. TaxID=2025608 RepID=UPI003568487B